MIQEISPLPFVDENGNLHHGIIREIVPYCRACQSRDCVEGYASDGTTELQQCSKGAFCIRASDSEGDVVVWVGLLVKGKKYPRNFKQIKRKGIELDPEALSGLLKKFSNEGELASKIHSIKQSAQSQALHDLKPLISVLTSKVERGEVELAQKADVLSPEQTRLLQSLAFEVFQILGAIKNQVDLADYIVAPDAISSKSASVKPLHGIWMKHVKIYETLAEPYGKRIELSNTPGNDIHIVVPDVFLLLPSILLDNALKYSANNSVIRVLFSDNDGETVTTVSSYGAIVPEVERGRIWGVGERVSFRQLVQPPGSGYGLYLAKQICDISGFEISYEAIPQGKIRGVPSGLNNFIIQKKEAPDRIAR